jgi:REP element-mobilizing transposase RayT
MPHSYTQLLYHVVFSTKNRHPWLIEPVRGRLYAYLGGAIRDEGGTALAVGGVADHVHLLARLRQDKAVSAVIGAVKANASGWIHREFAELAAFEWQEGYAAFTVSKSQVERVRIYIAGQQAHHRQRSFQEELVALLKAHDIEYDPRYLLAQNE